MLITDGADTASDTTLHELRPALVRSDAFVYAIAIDTPEPQAITKINVNTLNEITGQSGGRTEVVRSTADLEPATASIAEELNSQYVLGYASPHPGDGKFHSIRVRTTNPDLQSPRAQRLRRRAQSVGLSLIARRLSSTGAMIQRLQEHLLISCSCSSVSRANSIDPDRPSSPLF